MLLAVSSIISASTLTDWGSIWAIIAGVIATVVAIWGSISWILKRRAKQEHEKVLEQPCNVYFLIPETTRARLDYVEQDNREHKTDCLVLPAHAEIPIQLWIKPRVAYEETDMYFGCEGSINEKPEPIKYYNPFVYQGKREIVPGGEEGHYIDFHRYYHTVGKRVRVPTEVYVPGFMIRTHTSGEYEAQLLFHGTERVGLAHLRIVVEDPMATPIRCIDHENCFLKPRQQKPEE